MSETSGDTAAQSYPVTPDLPAAELALIEGLCAAECPEAYWIAEALAKRATDETLPEAIRQGWRLLVGILQMRFRPENACQAFGPIVQLADGRRSITPGDLTTEHLALLRAVATPSRDCEVLARISQTG